METKQETKHDAESYWRSKRLVPGQLIIRDITLEPKNRTNRNLPPSQNPDVLTISDDVVFDVPVETLIEEDNDRKTQANLESTGLSLIERTRAEVSLQLYGWMKHLRVEEPKENWKCRWM
jgi:hypothetical protein